MTSSSFTPDHCGLILSPDRIQQARDHRDEPPFSAAWALLDTLDTQTELDALLMAGWRYRLLGDEDAGNAGAERLRDMAWPLIVAPSADPQDPLTVPPDIAAYKAYFGLCHAVELLRPALVDIAPFAQPLQDALSHLPTPAPEDALGGLWHAVAQMAGGVVLEQADPYHAAVQMFRQTIDAEVHPEGYFRTAVKADPEARSLHNQLLGASALVLLAEASACAGVGQNLWTYENRGVSAVTAATYTLYYYFYPGEWRWNGSEYRPSAGVAVTQAKALFRNHAGFLEILARRTNRPLKAAQMILNELRPIYDAYGGGPTTLTHATPQPKHKRRGWLF